MELSDNHANPPTIFLRVSHRNTNKRVDRLTAIAEPEDKNVKPHSMGQWNRQPTNRFFYVKGRAERPTKGWNRQPANRSITAVEPDDENLKPQ